jgi:hypothetical protein
MQISTVVRFSKRDYTSAWLRHSAGETRCVVQL